MLVVLVSSYILRKSKSVHDFFMGGNEARWFGVGASIFSLIGGGEIVALTALGFSYGFPALNQSTQDSYTRCPGHSDIARLRVLSVCQCCVA